MLGSKTRVTAFAYQRLVECRRVSQSPGPSIVVLGDVCTYTTPCMYAPYVAKGITFAYCSMF